MSIKIGINGVNGRIGSLVLRASYEHPDIEVAGVNATIAPDYLEYMLKYDTMHGRWDHEVKHTDNSIIIDGKEIPVSCDRDILNLNWGAVGAEYIIDATGKFKTIATASDHLKVGAKKVVITAPSDDAPVLSVPPAANAAADSSLWIKRSGYLRIGEVK